MELTEHRQGNHHVIREVTDQGVRIDQAIYHASLVVGARFLETDWPVCSLDDLDEDRLSVLLGPQPELVVVGIGRTHQVPPIELQMRFVEQGIGFECMTLPAAARTFNVLMSENRRALAALIMA
ncbi:hypothetical protein IC757_05945 [Wenzhouxiangella sp. AB-CW3]|uniref:Mth938-like domain-containing protein n=1 Tax=Wenzhouxiangella sp. AB-CW3 TaxID=2771012 RepID=UPI00168BF05D|nr:MTH938/NDUFAF3 family protein [Wenzhouxiangella sp. AB-CW3]QOC23677.1 hypothetical protein IC757_05945 [Wenzhouxiangella sp. AB-CW3]